MTWVVGAVSPFGHTIILSDIRVSFDNGRTEGDYIQKSYCIGRYLLGGFSGSVRIGFELLADLHGRLRLKDEDMAWFPRPVAEAWAPRAASIFERHSDSERAAGCSILIGGVSPTENNGDAPFAKTYLARLVAPTFKPTYGRQGMAALQVGSGSRVRPYKSLVLQYFRNPRFVTNFGGWDAGGLGTVLASSLGREIAAKPIAGVSPHLHVVACSRGKLHQCTNDFNEIDRDREVPILKMPPVATTYEDFLQLARQGGHRVAAARA